MNVHLLLVLVLIAVGAVMLGVVFSEEPSHSSDLGPSQLTSIVLFS